MNLLGNDWNNAVAPFFDTKALSAVVALAEEDARLRTVYPPRSQWFRAFSETPFSAVRAVILGQDPYHGPGQANGLAFSVNPGVKIPPSLRNILKELQSDCGITPPDSGDLTAWAENGVLLLNTVLTVREAQPGSHRKLGWEQFTDAVLDALNQKEGPVAFLLWGNDARRKAERLTNPRHLVLEAAHPSPLSASHGFFGCRHFSKATQFLAKAGIPLDWNLSSTQKEEL